MMQVAIARGMTHLCSEMSSGDQRNVKPIFVNIPGVELQARKTPGLYV